MCCKPLGTGISRNSSLCGQHGFDGPNGILCVINILRLSTSWLVFHLSATHSWKGTNLLAGNRWKSPALEVQLCVWGIQIPAAPRLLLSKSVPVCLSFCERERSELLPDSSCGLYDPRPIGFSKPQFFSNMKPLSSLNLLIMNCDIWSCSPITERFLARQRRVGLFILALNRATL